MSSSTRPRYPVGTRVVLHGLQKALEHNGKSGVVQSIGPERLQVCLVDDKTNVLAVRASNLELEPRPVASLSIKELKVILQKSKHGAPTSVGMDKHNLQSAVAACSTPEENAEILLAYNQEKQQSQATPAAPMEISTEQIKKATEQMNGMDPVQLRQQAAMLKNLPPDVLRSQNPMMRNMTDEQIRQAAAQFEMMASNPAMMKAATEQLSGLSSKDLGRQMGANNSSTRETGVATSFPANPAEMLKSLDPEMIQQQAEIMKSMQPSQLRALNPQFANMSDEQIQQIAVQMDVIATNPALMKMAAEHVKNMSPEEMEALQAQGMSMGGNGGVGPEIDPMAFLANTSGKQIKELFQAVKANPDLLRSVAPNVDSAQINTVIDKLGSMDESTLDRIISVLTKLWDVVRPVVRVYRSVNQAVAGQLLKIIVLLPVAVVLFRWYGRPILDKTVNGVGEISSDEPEVTYEDEF